MRFSIRLNNDYPVQKYVRLAQIAEAAGFDQFWVSHDLMLRSAPVILSAIACQTQRIQIGTCILNPYTINPAEIAMLAATLDELSQGRFNLGISSGAGDFLHWIGLEQAKPRTAVLESIQAINALMRGESAAMEGHFLKWGQAAYLRFTPSRRVPIYLGAMSPKMLEAIGEVADGGLPLLLPPEHLKNVLPYVAAGAARANRSLDEIDLAACIWVSIADDDQAALDMLKEKVAYYGHAMSPLILQQLGLSHADFTEIEQVVMRENNLEQAKTLVTDQMLQIGIAGNAAALIKRLEGLVALGVRHISFGPPLGPDLEKAIEILGRDVIPHFRRHA